MWIFSSGLPAGSGVVPSGGWLGDPSEGGNARGPYSASGRVLGLAALGAASRCGRIKKPGAGLSGLAPGAAGCGQGPARSQL